MMRVGAEQAGYWMTFPVSSPSFTDAVSSPKVKGGDLSASTDDAPVKVRKPYTITKQRERWTEEEHQKFLEALKLYGRAWRRIEEHIGTKTAVQIRSHAQKFFSKLEREASLGGSSATEIPPPRPKRKPSHPYPRKAGGAFSSSPSFEEDSKSSPAVCSAFTPLESLTGTTTWKVPTKVLQVAFKKTGSSAASLRLFGQTFVPGSDKPEADVEQVELPHSVAMESTGSPRSQVSVETEELSSISPPISNTESGVWDQNACVSQPEEGRGLTSGNKPQGCKATAGFQAWEKDSDTTHPKIPSHMDKPNEKNIATSSSAAYECQAFQQAGKNLDGSCFTPWQPASFAMERHHTAPFPAYVPTFWQGLMPHSFDHSKNEDANTAAAIAAATFAVASVWQTIQGAIPIANNDSNISMVYSPIAMLAAARKPVSVLGAQGFRPQSPLEPLVNAHEIKKREQESERKCNGSKNEQTSVHGEDSTAECCSSLTDTSRLSSYEIYDEGAQAKKRFRSSCEVDMHLDRETSKLMTCEFSDSKRNANAESSSVGNGLEVMHNSNGTVAVQQRLTDNCMEKVIGPSDKDVTEKSYVQEFLQSEANYRQNLQTAEDDSASIDNYSNDVEQITSMHTQSGPVCKSVQAWGTIQHDSPLETDEGANKEEMPPKDNHQFCDSKKETVLPSTMLHSGANKKTSSKECASSCLKMELKDGNRMHIDVNERCAETAEHLSMIKPGLTSSSRYSGVGFVPYKRSLRMELSSMKVDIPLQ